MKAKIYFWKHGFQTTGQSLWVVELSDKKKLFTKSITVKFCEVESKFSKVNPHAYFLIDCDHYVDGVGGKGTEIEPCKRILFYGSGKLTSV